ncbi:hypothetical protein SprV_0501841700 [Sparganum proliferum]
MQPPLDGSQIARNVLLPVNLAEHSRRALDWYATNIYKSDDFIHVLYILEPSYAANNFGLTAGGGQVKSGEINSMLAEHIELSKTLGHEFLLRIQERGLQGNYVLCVGTRPGEQIVSYAKENNVDLIVMGSRGVGTLRRTVFGSVSDYVLHRVNVPMAVVPLKTVPKETRRYSMK